MVIYSNCLVDMQIHNKLFVIGNEESQTNLKLGSILKILLLISFTSAFKVKLNFPSTTLDSNRLLIDAFDLRNWTCYCTWEYN